MYEIGICDDDREIGLELEVLVKEILQKQSIEAQIEIWCTGEELCEYLQEGNKLDLLFLDIEMDDMNGVEIGQFIRNKLENLQITIIYISYHQSYMMQLFKVQPLEFLVKPLQYEQIQEVLALFLKRMEQQHTYLRYQVNKVYFQQDCHLILYLSSNDKKIQMMTLDGKREFYGKLQDVAVKLPSSYIQVHKSYIINPEYIATATYEAIIMQNKEMIPISKPYRKAVREKIFANQRGIG